VGKNTPFALGHGFLTLYNTSQQRKLGSEVRKMQARHDEAIRRASRETNYAIAKATTMTLEAIKNVADLQAATMSGLVVMDKKLEDISKAAWDLQNYFKTRDEREAFLKGLALDIEDQMEFIQSYSEGCPEYAIIQLEELKGIIEYHQVVPEHYLILSSVTDIKWAKNVLLSVDNFHYELSNSLGD